MTTAARGEGWYFHPTDEEGAAANLVAFVTTMVSLGFAVLVLLASALVWSDKRTRHHFRRSSTRMLLACVAFVLPYGIGYGVTALPVARTNSKVCAASMWWLLVSYNVVNFLQSAICINLVLALYKPDAFRYNLHLTYYVVSIVLAILIASIPLPFNVYRFSPSKYSCWMNGGNPSVLVDPWQTAVIEVPIFVVTLLMIAAIVAIALKIYKQKTHAAQERTLNQLYQPVVDFEIRSVLSENDLSNRFEITEQTFVEDATKRPLAYRASSSGSPEALYGQNVWGSPRGPSQSIYSEKTAGSSSKRRALMRSSLAGITEEPPALRKIKVARLPMAPNMGIDPTRETSKELRRTVIRIAVFPVVHFCVVMVGLVASLLLSASAGHSRGYQYRLYVAEFFGSAWIPLAYTSCAVFADNSLYLGLREWWYLRHLNDDTDLEVALGRNAHLKRGSRNSSMAGSIAKSDKPDYGVALGIVAAATTDQQTEVSGGYVYRLSEKPSNVEMSPGQGSVEVMELTEQSPGAFMVAHSGQDGGDLSSSFAGKPFIFSPAPGAQSSDIIPIQPLPAMTSASRRSAGHLSLQHVPTAASSGEIIMVDPHRVSIGEGGRMFLLPEQHVGASEGEPESPLDVIGFLRDIERITPRASVAASAGDTHAPGHISLAAAAKRVRSPVAPFLTQADLQSASAGLTSVAHSPLSQSHPTSPTTAGRDAYAAGSRFGPATIDHAATPAGRSRASSMSDIIKVGMSLPAPEPVAVTLASAPAGGDADAIQGAEHGRGKGKSRLSGTFGKLFGH